ncbi:MAG: glycosyltransferase family 4 protein [Chitinispirillaceae bacterium]|jgi:glycosyltransferase involved in cell wall biosynthesis
MNIVLTIRDKIPVKKYGGTERVVAWLADALVKKGHSVFIAAPQGSTSPCAEIIEIKPRRSLYFPLPAGIDIVHNHTLPAFRVNAPSLVTFHWIVKPDFVFPPNTIFLSRMHAAMYESTKFVYNGLDPSEYLFNDQKDDYLLFMSRVSRSSKGVDKAIALAKRMGFKLIIAGGYTFTLNRKIRSVGMVGGRKKAELIANARALLFPISWGEPFGLIMIEALVSGTPVIATPCGAVPEIVTPDVGFLCAGLPEMEQAVERINEISPHACRRRVMEHFTSEKMAENYLKVYGQVIEKGKLAD